MKAGQATRPEEVAGVGSRDGTGTLGLALLLWLCLLPFAVLVLGPILGARGTVGAMAALFVILLGICWGVCAGRRPVP